MPIQRAPSYFWLVGAGALLWNAFGCYDFAMKVSHNRAYIAQLSSGAIEYFDAYPVWAFAAWLVGVWGAMLGAALLLVRRRWAVQCFAASLFGLAVNTVYDLSRASPLVPGSSGTTIVTVVVWIVAIALVWFSMRMRTRRVLR